MIISWLKVLDVYEIVEEIPELIKNLVIDYKT
jgi:hypothetical protein